LDKETPLPPRTEALGSSGEYLTSTHSDIFWQIKK